jgi:hypothetical protein
MSTSENVTFGQNKFDPNFQVTLIAAHREPSGSSYNVSYIQVDKFESSDDEGSPLNKPPVILKGAEQETKESRTRFE